jgi:hypothetical protein
VAFVEQAAPEVDVASLPGLDHGAGAGGAAEPWPLPARLVDHLVLDSPRATVLYWASVALVIAGLFVTALLPCVDYPQHLALSDVARRLASPNAPEHALYQLNYFTYNGLFHILVAGLSTVLPIEFAGRVVVGLSLLATAAAVVALVRIVRRPSAYAALSIPILFSFSVGWGFVNYVLATAIAAWALVFVARAAIRPTLVSSAAVLALGMACAFAHVLAMLILCAFGAVLALEAAWRAAPRSGSRGRRALRAGLCGAAAVAPLLVGCLYCVEVYRRQYVWDPNMYRDPTIEGSAPPLADKIIFFGAYSTDLYHDGSDQVLVWGAVAIMAWSAMLAWKQRHAWDGPREETHPIVTPLVAMTIAYFATPMVLIGTHLIFPRMAQWVILGGVLAMPRFLDVAGAARARGWILRLGFAAGLNTFVHCAIYAWETKDASRLIDDLPPGGAATAVIWDPWSLAFNNPALTHLAAYYAARKHGRWAFAFARYLSVPVRFKPNSQPAWPARGWEFDADEYDARCKYARAFPLVIVKAPAALSREASGEGVVRELVFGSDISCSAHSWHDAQGVKLLSHHGAYWAFDTAGLPNDGTF